MPEILCDTCGEPVQGGLRRYVDTNGKNRIGCDDDHACASAYSRLTKEQHREIARFRFAGYFLRLAEAADA